MSSKNRSFIQILGFTFLFCIGTAALVVSVLAYIQQRDGISQLRSTTDELQENVTRLEMESSSLQENVTLLEMESALLQENVTHLEMESLLLQNQIVEISMNLANETILQEGTFIWSVGGIRDRQPGEVCSSSSFVVTGFAIDAPGTGYRVGDLVTVLRQDVPTTLLFFSNPVLKVTGVGLGGEVQAFDVLTPGCLSSNPLSNNSIPSISIVGSGLMVKRYAGPYPPITDSYYEFQTPQAVPVAPLQYANYSLRQVTIESVAYTVIYLYPPEFPITLQFSSPSEALTFALYEFAPLIPELQALGSYAYIFPLTNKNYNAISLPDNINCLATNTNCWLDSRGVSSRRYPNAFSLLNFRYGLDLQISNHFFYWHFTSTGYTHDYVANNAVFTLNYPLMLVLPSL